MITKFGLSAFCRTSLFAAVGAGFAASEFPDIASGNAAISIEVEQSKMLSPMGMTIRG